MSYEYKEHRRILLIDDNTRKLQLRANVLRNHEIEVHTCAAIAEASALWRTTPYDLVLLAGKDELQTQACAAQIRSCKPRQRIGLLVGPPAFIRELARRPRLLPPSANIDRSQAPLSIEPASNPHWQQTVARVVAGWYSDHRLTRKAATDSSTAVEQELALTS